jgi:hypothetical protein
LSQFYSPEFSATSKAAKVGRFFPVDKTMTLSQAYEQLNSIDSLLQNAYAAPDEAVKKSTAFIGALKSAKKVLKDHIHVQYPGLEAADATYDANQGVIHAALDNFGDNQKAADFVRTGLFENTSKKEIGRQAFNAIDQAMPNNMKYGYGAKLAGSAEYLNIGKVEPSGFQFSLLPKIVGGVAGGAIGAATTPEGENPVLHGAAGAAIGVGAVSAAQYPFLSPRSASKAMKFLEGKGVTTATNVANAGIKYTTQSFKALAAPITAYIEDIQSQFGQSPTDEDMKVLKGSRVGAMK